MEEDQGLHDEDLLPFDFTAEYDEKENVKDTGEEVGGEVETFAPKFGVSHEAKLRELLRNLCSIEVKICSDASKEFVKLLKEESGGRLLHLYFQSSPKCLELLEAWRLRQGKQGMSYVFALVAAVLGHPCGKKPLTSVAMVRVLDAFARSIITQKLDDIYVELKSEEPRRQNAALLLLAGIVRRGMSLSSEVAKVFDFKMSVLSKLSGVQKRKGSSDTKKHHRKNSTRKAFVEFAMSFLEAGNPRLLRWILQQRDVYSGVLRGLGADDEDTIVFVLTTLRDRVLADKSLVPPALRSVLFGSVTLEQLVTISGSPEGGTAADLAHEVLVKVCTDPSNGLMPGNDMKGNSKRLLDLMKKLKATEIRHHKDLLLAIVEGRPSLCSLYMDAYPYNLDPSTSYLWFSAISLAADLVLSTNSGAAFKSLITTLSANTLNLEDHELQCILKCIVPCFFTRTVSNKGLLHSDISVKHGCLRLLLEILKSLHNLLSSIDQVMESMTLKHNGASYERSTSGFSKLPGFELFEDANMGFYADKSNDSQAAQLILQKWSTLKQHIQDEVRSKLPDSQVLLKLLSSVACNNTQKPNLNLKRCANVMKVNSKRLKSKASSEEGEVDIIISGINYASSATGFELIENDKDGQEMDYEDGFMGTLYEIWSIALTDTQMDFDILFHTKLLDALTLYLCTVPSSLEGSFDFFKILPADPSSISVNQRNSLLSLLVEYTGCSSGTKCSTRLPEMMYKHLSALAHILITSETSDQNKAYVLAKSAMLSTGAFDQNPSEVDAWLLFLPDCKDRNFARQEMNRSDAPFVISFLCDAVSTIGNSLYRYMNDMRLLVCKLQDTALCFSPLSLCILQKSLRLLESESKNSKVSERTTISLYVSNTLIFLLQTQGNSGLLAGIIDYVLSEKFGNSSLAGHVTTPPQCEWKPLKNLLVFARNILHNKACNSLFSSPARSIGLQSSSLHTILDKVKKSIKNERNSGYVKVATSLSDAIVCATVDDLLECFPFLITISQPLLGPHSWGLSLILGLEFDFLRTVANKWPKLLLSALSMTYMIGESAQNGADLLNQKNILDAIDGQSEFNDDLDSNKHASVAFSHFLKHAPFNSIFAPLLSFYSYNLEISYEVLEFLRAKLSQDDIEKSVSSLRLLLFWSHQIRSTYLSQPSTRLEKLSEMCFVLIECILDCHMKVPSISGVRCGESFVLEIAEAIFLHPMLDQILSHMLLVEGKTPHSLHSVEDVISSSEQAVHPMDRRALHLVSRIGSFLFVAEDDKISYSCIPFSIPDSLLETFKNILEKSLKLFKESFRLCCLRRDLKAALPGFYLFHSFLKFLCPYNLLQLGHWMLCEVGKKNAELSSEMSVLSVTLHNVHTTLSRICTILKENKLGMTFLRWDLEGGTCEHLLADVYSMLFNCATIWSLEIADLCLLKFVDIAYMQKVVTPPAYVLPFNMLMLNLIAKSSVNILLYCTYKTNKTKAEILFKLVELSPLCSHFFCMVFFDVLGSDLSLSNLHEVLATKGEFIPRGLRNEVSKEKTILLLPAALSVLTGNLLHFQRCREEVSETIPLFYLRLLLDGFSNWRSFAYSKLFLEEPDKSIFTSEEFESAFRNTLLGKSMQMLTHSFSIQNAIKRKQRLKSASCVLDASLLDGEEVLCDQNLREMTYSESFNTVNKILAKISFAWLLLSPPINSLENSVRENDEKSKMSSVRKETEREKDAKMRFLKVLTDSWHKIVRIFTPKQGFGEKTECGSQYHLLRFFEVSLLRNVVRLVMNMKDSLDQSTCMSFVDPFVKSALLFRFDDPCTLRVIYEVLTILNGLFSAGHLLELFLGHSKFVSTILKRNASLDSCGLDHTGTFLQPVPSILRSLDVLFSESSSSDLKHDNEVFLANTVKLELVRVLRLLYNQAVQQDETYSIESIHVNTGDLLLLLLSAYSASLTELDMEIFQFIQDMETASKSSVGTAEEHDYLWGGSAFKISKQETVDVLEKSGENTDGESVQQWSKRKFRENIEIDARRCASTVLKFPYGRPFSGSSTSLEEYCYCDLMTPSHLTRHNEVEGAKVYDPVFIMRFSIHCLSKGYIEPVEFARIGLLAVAFLGISSLDENIRKLGYEVLGSFRRSLMNYQRGKDVLQLELLLSYLQNGITEPWQRIPSMIALFAAEASFILLDVSQDHFFTISKFLMHSSRADLKDIPLFHSFFRSSSIHHKSERTWILRLLYAGLNSEDDAQIIIRKFILELVLSFYSSTLSDSETRILILQIIKKSMKVHVLARCLIEHCGIIAWLYHVLLDCGQRISNNQNDIFQDELKAVLQVVLGVVSFRFTVEWLQKFALEQLSQISCYLHMLLLDKMVLLKENLFIVNTIILIITSNLKISQKRKVYKPHFILSLEGLYQLFEVFTKELSNVKFHPTNELGLKMLLMTAPTPVTSQMDKVKILKIIMWAIPIALGSCIGQQPLLKEVELDMPKPFAEEKHDESLTSKLLRWIVASVILGSISSSCSLTHLSLQGNELKDMQSLLKYIRSRRATCKLGSEVDSSINKALSITILYLQQILGTETRFLSSVSLSLYLLLLDRVNLSGEFPFGDDNQLASLCSKIRSPYEASASWRWSFYQPWKDLSFEESSIQRTTEEEHASHTLLLMFSHYLGGGLAGQMAISHQDLAVLLTWRMSILGGSG